MRKWKQALALVLALVMALSLVALPSFAADGDAADGTLPNGVSVVNPGGPTEGVTGMEMSKTLQLNADGKTGILTLEAYATGQSQVVQKDVPLDIVLVLDTSGSMDNKISEYHETYSISNNGTYYYMDSNGQYQQAYYCDGEYFSWGTKSHHTPGWYSENHQERRQCQGETGTRLTPKTSPTDTNGVQFFYTSSQLTRMNALKTAVNNFAESVAAKAKGADGQYGGEDDVNYRIAVVEFASEAYNLTNGLVDMDTSRGLTQVKNAVSGLQAGGDTYPATGLNMANSIYAANPISGDGQRGRVVIMFTDGYPAESGTDNINYTLCDNAIASAQTSKGKYGATVYTVGIFSGANPNSNIDTNFDYGNRRDAVKQLVAANRYMQYTSSNFQNAQSLRNGGEKSSSSYYLAASDAAGLNNVFSSISSTIGGSDSTLTDTATMVDVISEYFQLPDNYQSSLKAYTVPFTGTDASGNRQWGANQTDYTTSINVEGSKVSITGFNYSENWVGFNSNAGSQTPHGSKMVLEIPIQVKDDTVGEVLTNDLNNSGILDGNGDMFANFESPVVKYAYFTVVPVTSSVDNDGKNKGTPGQEKQVRLLDNPTYNLVNEVPKDYLYGGTFDEETCINVNASVKGQNPMAITPVENEIYYIWEVPDTYLRPFTFYVWQHVDGKKTVTKLYPLVGVDRTNYADVGFSVCWGSTYDKKTAANIQSGCNELSTSAKAGTAEVYQYLLATKSGAPVESWYLLNGKATSYMGDITATDTIIDEGCIGGFRLDAQQFENFKSDGITYRPYWITLDGVRVDSVRSRTLTFQEGSATPIYDPNQTGRYSAGYTYVNTPATQTLSFRTCMLADDSQPAVDERLTVTVVDGSNTTQVKVAPNGSVRNQVAYQAPAGKVFAGWFADQAYTIPADLDQVTEDTTIYAKYVSDSYLDLHYVRNGLFRLRGVTLISAVDNPANYQESGIIVDGVKVPVAYANRYMLFNTPASLFGAARNAKLMIAHQSLSGSGTLEVTPYWVTKDGTTVLGQPHTLHYSARGIWE